MLDEGQSGRVLLILLIARQQNCRSAPGQGAADARQAEGVGGAAGREAAYAAISAALARVVGAPGKEEVTAALRAQLEHGNVVRSLTAQHCCPTGQRYLMPDRISLSFRKSERLQERRMTDGVSNTCEWIPRWPAADTLKPSSLVHAHASCASLLPAPWPLALKSCRGWHVKYP